MKLTCLPAKWIPAVSWSAASVFLVFALTAAPAKADTCSAAPGNLVTNCGFESGTFSGWTLHGNLQGGLPPNSFYGVDSAVPNSGANEGYFGVQGGGGGAVGTLGPFLALTQSLDLTAGEAYQLSFALSQNAPASAPNYVNYFDAMLGGTTLFTETNAPNSGGYQTFQFAYTPQSTGSKLLQFDFQNDSDYFYFDDVVLRAVNTVPEPATASLLIPAAGFALLTSHVVRRARP